MAFANANAGFNNALNYQQVNIVNFILKQVLNFYHLSMHEHHMKLNRTIFPTTVIENKNE